MANDILVGVPGARPLAPLNAENLRRIMEDKGTGPGWYPSAELYSWYVGLCDEAQMKPVRKASFGEALKILGYESSTRRVDGKLARGWFISRRALRGEADPAAMRNGSSA